MSEYTKVCVLRRCGQLQGDPKCCQEIWTSGLRDLVMEHMWHTIEREKCAQFCEGYCISRGTCGYRESFCYPIPLRKKKINHIVATMLAWWAVDSAEQYKDFDSRLYDLAVKNALDTADAVNRCYWYRSVDADAVNTAYYAIRSALDCRLSLIEEEEIEDEIRDEIQDEFYYELSKELVRLIDAWGDERK